MIIYIMLFPNILYISCGYEFVNKCAIRNPTTLSYYFYENIHIYFNLSMKLLSE